MRLDEAARRYMDVPFLHQGRDPAVGIDCIGLGELALGDIGVFHETNEADYSRDPHGGLLEARLESMFGPPFPLDQMRAGDIAVIRYGRQLRHVGIVGERSYGGIPRLTLIHTDSRIGKVVEHRIDEGWMGRRRPAIGCVFRPEKSP